jgi:hypothetical protein
MRGLGDIQKSRYRMRGIGAGDWSYGLVVADDPAVDIFSRYLPVLYPRFSYRGDDVVQTLERGCTASTVADAA